MAILAPSILSADFSNLSEQIRLVEMGGADWIHCDIMDGHFVPNISFGPSIVKTLRNLTSLPLDVHLMIQNPDYYLEQFIDAGADYISVHAEEVIHLNRTINRIKQLGAKAGVVINPSTPVLMLKDIIDYTDFVLIMTVNPGFGGQSFIPNSGRRIAELHELRSSLSHNVLIEVDGGIDAGTIKTARNAGADIFVAGSSIFHSDNITAATAELKNLINSG